MAREGEPRNRTTKERKDGREKAKREKGSQRERSDGMKGLLEVDLGSVALSLGGVVVEVESFVAVRVVEGRNESIESAAASRVGSVDEGRSTFGVGRSEVVSSVGVLEELVFGVVGSSDGLSSDGRELGGSDLGVDVDLKEEEEKGG